MRLTLPFCGELAALLNTKTVLLINHHKAECRELRRLCEEGVCADQQRGRTRLRGGANASTFWRREASNK